jgi:beta-N-acetylhexosaminidase
VTRTAMLIPLLALLGTAACGGGSAAGSGAARSSSTTRAATPTAPTTGTATPTTAGGTAATSAPTTCAGRTLAALTDRQRVGQLFVVGVPTTTAAATAAGIAAATQVSAGGYLLYGGSDAPLSQIRALTDQVSAELTGAAGGVRPFVAVDQEGGQVQPLRGTGFSAMPTALTQGSWAASTLRDAARGWGAELARAGIDVAFAPVADVVPARLAAANQPIGHYEREFGATPPVVSDHVAAFVAGLQSAGVAATAKHFPGLGRVIDNTDTSSGVVDTVTTADDPSLAPFAMAVRSGVRFVMVSSASYPKIDAAHLAVFSPTVIGLLRTRFGFRGLIVSDDLGAARQVADVPAARRGVGFLAAGGQLVVAVKPASVVPVMVDGVIATMRSDPAFRTTVDAAVLAVLQAKQQAGLLPC